MVSTDAAARGLDIPHVTHVVQADFASSAVDFIHRVSLHAQLRWLTRMFVQLVSDCVQCRDSACIAEQNIVAIGFMRLCFEEGWVVCYAKIVRRWSCMGAARQECNCPACSTPSQKDLIRHVSAAAEPRPICTEPLNASLGSHLPGACRFCWLKLLFSSIHDD